MWRGAVRGVFAGCPLTRSSVSRQGAPELALGQVPTAMGPGGHQSSGKLAEGGLAEDSDRLGLPQEGLFK